MVSRVFRIPFRGGVAPAKGILNMSDIILYVFSIMAANQLCLFWIQCRSYKLVNEEWHIFVIIFTAAFLFLTWRSCNTWQLLSPAQHQLKRLSLSFLQGWSGGAMVLGKLPVPGHPTVFIRVGQGPTVLALGAVGGCLDIFTLVYPFSPLSPSLWETARYRLKYCLKGP